MSRSSFLALGPRALRNVGGISPGPGAPLARIWRMASSMSSFRKVEQHLSPAVGDFSVDFSCRIRLLSPLLKRRRLTAAYSFMKALALSWLGVKARHLCSRGWQILLSKGLGDSNLIVLHSYFACVCYFWFVFTLIMVQFAPCSLIRKQKSKIPISTDVKRNRNFTLDELIDKSTHVPDSGRLAKHRLGR